MRGFWSRFFGRECDHRSVLVVTSVGVRRSICENCGHLSFEFLEMIETRESVSRAGGDLPRVEGF